LCAAESLGIPLIKPHLGIKNFGGSGMDGMWKGEPI